MSLPCVFCEITLQGFHSFAQHLLYEHFCYDCLLSFTGPDERRSYLYHNLFKHDGNKTRCKAEVVNRFADILPIFWKESDDSFSNREKFELFLSSSWSKFLESSLLICKTEDKKCGNHNDSNQSASESIVVTPSTSATGVLRDASNESLPTGEKLGVESSNPEDAVVGVENFGEIYENLQDVSAGFENFDQMRGNTPIVANANYVSAVRVIDENTVPSSSFVAQTATKSIKVEPEDTSPASSFFVENAAESVAALLPIATAATNKSVRRKRSVSEIANYLCATKLKSTQNGDSCGNGGKSGGKCRKSSENLGKSIKSKSSSSATVFARALKELSLQLIGPSVVPVTPPHCSGFLPPGGAASSSNACVDNQNEEVENVRKEEFPCQICSQICVRSTLGRHVLMHFQTESVVFVFQCCVCTSPFKTKGTLIQHLKRVHGFLNANELKIGVHYVDRQLLLKEEIAEVRRRAFPENAVAPSSQKISVEFPAVCDMCKDVVLRDLRGHVVKHIPEICRIKWFYKCLQCEFTSFFVQGIHNHVRKFHGNVDVQGGVHYEEAESIEDCIETAVSRCFTLQ